MPTSPDLIVVSSLSGGEGVSGEPPPHATPPLRHSRLRLSTARVDAGKLRRQMILRGWSCIDLARFAGISPTTVSAAVNGHPVAAKTIRKMAAALAKTPAIAGADELLAWTQI